MKSDIHSGNSLRIKRNIFFFFFFDNFEVDLKLLKNLLEKKKILYILFVLHVIYVTKKKKKSFYTVSDGGDYILYYYPRKCQGNSRRAHKRGETFCRTRKSAGTGRYGPLLLKRYRGRNAFIPG